VVIVDRNNLSLTVAVQKVRTSHFSFAGKLTNYWTVTYISTGNW